MILLPAHAEPAANAGTGPEGHRRTSSADSGTSSDSTLVAANDVDSIDSTIDGSHKSVATGKLRTSPPEPLHEHAASDPELVAHDAKRGRVSTDTASGAPALATHTHTAGSPTAAAPMTVSIYTATALAVADPYVNALDEPDDASDAGHREAAPAHSAAAAATRDAAAAAASSVALDGVMALGTPAPASSAIVDHSGPAPASASTTTGAATAGAAGARGSATSASATIDANPTSRGDTGCPETPVISRRSHAVAIRAFSIGRTSTAAPAPQAGGSKSAVIVANATSRGGAHCPPTPVVSRSPVPRSHAIPGAVVNGGQYGAFSIGLPCSARSATAPAPATTLAGPAAPAVQPIPTAVFGHFGRAGSHAPPQSLPSRIDALRAISRVVQRGMAVIRNALVALFKGDVESTNGRRSTSPGTPDEDRCWDEGAPSDAVLLGLRKRQRRRFL